MERFRTPDTLQQIWEIRSTTSLIGFRRYSICGITRRIGTGTCHIGNGKLSCKQYSLSPSFSWRFPPSPLNSTITQEHNVKSCCYLTMSWSWVDKECNIHQLLHHSKIDCLLLPACFSSLSGFCCTQLSAFPQLVVNQCIESQLRSHLTPDLLPLDQLLRSTPPITVHYNVQPHFQTCSIRTSECISVFTRSWRHLQVRLEFALRHCLQPVQIKLTWLWPSSISLRSDEGWTEIQGSIYLDDPGVDRHHPNFISSYHTMKNTDPYFSQLFVTVALSEISWIHTIAWILTAW